MPHIIRHRILMKNKIPPHCWSQLCSDSFVTYTYIWLWITNSTYLIWLFLYFKYSFSTRQNGWICSRTRRDQIIKTIFRYLVYICTSNAFTLIFSGTITVLKCMNYGAWCLWRWLRNEYNFSFTQYLMIQYLTLSIQYLTLIPDNSSRMRVLSRVLSWLRRRQRILLVIVLLFCIAALLIQTKSFVSYPSQRSFFRCCRLLHFRS